ncbi:molybdate ABC transporter substrate-binding protein [Egbenema bharatensis]|uniref:molybdate ABC transporter substrate-binding protein n=1 Tax=Egbenema bharatensis TaxID=3463334 RepID=UPI003A84A13F
MKVQRLLTWLGLFVIALSFAVGCGGTSLISLSNPPTAPSTTLTVSAAATLQNVLEAIDPLFEQAHSDIEVSYNFASSGSLQQQIEQGAPTDVFISAATKQMNTLQEKNLILTETRRNMLSNRLALVVPKNSTLNLSDFRQLADTRVNRISIGEPRSVPLGQYAEEVFDNLNILESLQPKFVFASNIRGILSAVESGNADAGIVFVTDAQASDNVELVTIADEALHQPIVYPIAVVSSSPNVEAANTYTQFLFEDEARDTFQQFGFGTPGS